MTAAQRGILAVLIAFLAGAAFVAVMVITNLPSGRIGEVVQQASIGGPFRMVDQNGAPFTEERLKGKPSLMFFGFTHCPDVCPTALFEMSEILRGLGKDADRLSVIFVSVDPERDTPAVMKDYLSSFDPHLIALSGTEADTQAMMRAYRVYAKKVPLEGDDYTMDHSAIVYLMDKNGRFVAPFNTKRSPDEAIADLRKIL